LRCPGAAAGMVDEGVVELVDVAAVEGVSQVGAVQEEEGAAVSSEVVYYWEMIIG